MRTIVSIIILAFTLNVFSMEIKGTIANETGMGIAHSPIKFIMKKTKFDISTFEDKIVDSKVVVFNTDEKGFFKFIPKVDMYFNVFILEFSGDGFDYAKYILPDPEDISSTVKKGEGVVVNRTLKIHPDWLKLQIAIGGYEKSSPEYKVLRKYGFPDKRDKVQDLGEKWYYFQLGKEFLIKK